MVYRNQTATGSISISYGALNSVFFNIGRNLIRDQGVGGLNPLSPTNFFNDLQLISGLLPSAV